MAMPAMPGARFAMIESKIGFGPLEAFLNGPAQPCDGCEFSQRGAGWERSKSNKPARPECAGCDG